MKLSEAIRLGAMSGKKQIKGVFHDSDGGVCAQGAALYAIGKLRGGSEPQAMREVWPWSVEPYVGVIPEIEKLKNSETATRMFFRFVIAHLNNDCDWTFNEIADWVEQKEYELGIESKHRVQEENPVEVPETPVFV